MNLIFSTLIYFNRNERECAIGNNKKVAEHLVNGVKNYTNAIFYANYSGMEIVIPEKWKLFKTLFDPTK